MEKNIQVNILKSVISLFSLFNIYFKFNLLLILPAISYMAILSPTYQKMIVRLLVLIPYFNHTIETYNVINGLNFILYIPLQYFKLTKAQTFYAEIKTLQIYVLFPSFLLLSLYIIKDIISISSIVTVISTAIIVIINGIIIKNRIEDIKNIDSIRRFKVKTKSQNLGFITKS